MDAQTVDQTDVWLRRKMWALLQHAYGAYSRDLNYRDARPFEAGYRDIQFFLLDNIERETLDRAVQLGYMAKSAYSNDKGKDIFVIDHKGMEFLRTTVNAI